MKKSYLMILRLPILSLNKIVNKNVILGQMCDDPLTATLVTSTGTWHRSYGFFEVCQAEGRGSSPTLTKNFLCRCFCFVILFSQFFLMSPKGPPFIFSYFAKRMDVQKRSKAPLLHFLALCDLPETKKNRKKCLEKNFKKIGFFFQFFLTRVL